MLKNYAQSCLRLGLVTIAVLLLGCGKADEGPAFELVPVKGKVSAQGKPLADATVSFYPQGEMPSGFYGAAAKTDVNGGYELLSGSKPGAVIGKYKVTVSRLTNPQGAAIIEAPGMDLQQLKMQGQAIESLPAAYSDLAATQLSTTVEAGKAEGYDFDVQ